MRTLSPKSTVAGIAATAMLLTSGIVPTVTAAQAETVFVPGLTGKVQPKTPGSCVSKPWLCEVAMPEATPPTPPPPAPEPGINAGTAAAIGIVGGIIAGAALANAAKPKTVIVEAESHSSAHYKWCFEHYKSYVLETNSFMSYSGVRKPCISPYI